MCQSRLWPTLSVSPLLVSGMTCTPSRSHICSILTSFRETLKTHFNYLTWKLSFIAGKRLLTSSVVTSQCYSSSSSQWRCGRGAGPLNFSLSKIKKKHFKRRKEGRTLHPQSSYSSRRFPMLSREPIYTRSRVVRSREASTDRSGVSTDDKLDTCFPAIRQMTTPSRFEKKILSYWQKRISAGFRVFENNYKKAELSQR